MSNFDIIDIMKYKKMRQYRFIGVYPRNKIPSHTNIGDCLIFNNKSKIGEHWLALVHGHKHIYVYDSFGRSKEFFNLSDVYKMTDPKPEQNIYEENCGARCLAWLMTCDIFGVENVHEYI